MIESKMDSIVLKEKEYDAIISDAVLEHHRPEYIESFIKIQSSSLKDNGYFLCLWDPTFSEDYPYHIGASVKVEAILKRNGLIKVEDFVYIKLKWHLSGKTFRTIELYMHFKAKIIV